MNCDRCGTENPTSAKYCDGCGGALVRTCSSCGAVARASARFCGECGRALTSGDADRPLAPGSPVPASDGPLAGAISERRVCSVLFGDLVGFTPLSESRDPEEVREILSRYFDVARRLIGRYGGLVEKFIGDAVMAVWGTPVAGEGDTERAVRAALELVEAVSVLGAELGVPGLAARAGVVTGEVAVTIGASGEGMVAGDAVNTAARVQAAAAPGAVLADEPTRRLSHSAIAFEDAGEHELKGKQEPERLFRALRVLSGVGGKQRADGLEAPFTGRDVELRALKDLFHTSVERRTPRLVVVSGPAGVGKSRLGWEFEKYIDGLADTVLWHRGRCLSYGEGVAFWALAEIVRQRFGIAEEDPPETAAAKLQEGMVRFVADEAERDYVGVRLSRLLGVSFPSSSKVVLSKDELFAGWRIFFERLAQVVPVVILVEDVQHADGSLLDFFEHLIDWTRDLSIFVVLFARPGVEALDAGFGMGRNRSTLSLDPLDDSSMSSLVASLVPGIPDQARDAITARAQGIPLFAVETVRSLIDKGVVHRDGDAYRLVGELGDLAVPDSLHSLLAGRLDALPPDVRSIVADASVVGSSFPKDALVAVTGRAEPDVVQALAELVRRDVLEVFGDPLSPERGAYRFGQEMLRQVAYETLSKKDRKARHVAVAEHLRTSFANDGEEIADVIARHYLDALSAAPSDEDAPSVADQARDFLVRAGERSERSGALARAADSYAQAAEIAPDLLAATLFERACKASTDHGDFERAVGYADAAHARYLRRSDERSAARARVLKALPLQNLGRFDAARKELTEALDVLGHDPDRDTVLALGRLASNHNFSGNLAEGRRVITEALELGQALGVGTQDLARLFIGKGVATSQTDRNVEAAGYYELAARLAERAGDFGTLALAQLDLADVLGRSDPHGAQRAARSAVAHARRVGQRDFLGFAVANLSVVLIEMGGWSEADDVLRQALDEDHLDQDIVRYVSGMLAALRGDGSHATAMLESLAASRDSEEVQAQATVHVLGALTALCRGDLDATLADATWVIERSDVLGVGHEIQRLCWPIAARAARRLGRAETVEGLLARLDAHPAGHLPPILRAERLLVSALVAADAEPPGSTSAVDAVKEAVSSLREVDSPYELAHGLIDLADVLAAANEDGVDEVLAEARTIAERLGCLPLLARADFVEARYARVDASG